MHTQSTTPANAGPSILAMAEAIATLNDEMRQKPFGPGKRTVVTRAVNHMGADFMKRALAAIAGFRTFTSGNNVHLERDYGAFDLDNYKLMFKIDYLDVDGVLASEDPSDPAQTLRVMTIMFASEY
jgi:hypothetical protein